MQRYTSYCECATRDMVVPLTVELYKYTYHIVGQGAGPSFPSHILPRRLFFPLLLNLLQAGFQVMSRVRDESQ